MLDLHKIKFPKLHEGAFDRDGIKKEYLRNKGNIAVKNLKKNHFEAHYCDSKEEARQLLLSLIPDNATIGCGDSHTIFALELEAELENKNCVAIPHTCAVNHCGYTTNSSDYVIVGTKEESREILMQYLVANVFILGANAITIDGQIINVDGAGNRVAGGIYGSDRIIVIAGANKIVKDVASGIDRVHFEAAQMNNIKYNCKLPCVEHGICADCSNAKRICNITSIIHKRPMDSDYHVIIIGDELGF
jgi:hypothetical protein